MLTFAFSNRGVEQLVARRAHNPEAGGSSPSPATKQDTSFEVSFSFMSIPLTERTARPIFIPTSPYEQHRKQDCLEQQSMQTRLGIRVSSASQENNKCQ